jgi:CRISPR-associated protein Csy3
MSVKLPSVLSFQRGTIVSDGVMSSIVQRGDGSEVLSPVRVIRHGIRGVNNNPKKDGGVANIQRTESAKTSHDAIGLAVDFAFRTISSRDLLFACADPAYRAALTGFVDRYFVDDVPEFEEVCRRFARNILNGRWLWRNRVLGDVSVSVTSGERTYTGIGSRLRDFEAYTEDEKRLAEDVIKAGLKGDPSSVANVRGRVMFGFSGEVEVFPSQNMTTDKPKGFARSLYKVDMISRRDLLAIMNTSNSDGEGAGEFAADMIDMGRAALRDQKIGNAIRTIDTWYPEFNGLPIPIEPNGASLEQNKLYRDKNRSGAKDLLSLVDELKPGAEFDPRAAYLIALLIRGGVFSEGSD